MAATVTPRSDFVAALVWIVFGVAVIGGALAMDRMERFGAKAYTAPGLFPGILGGVVALLGVLLLVRSLRAGAYASLAQPLRTTPEGRATLVRTGLVMLLSLLYMLVLVGHGLPFWLATTAFVFVFMLVFYVPERPATGTAVRAVITSAVVAVATSATVTLVFERVFLVRMP